MPPGYSSGLTITFRPPQAEQMRRLPAVGTGVSIGRPRRAGGTSRSRPQALQYTQASLPSRSRSARVTGFGASVIMRHRTRDQYTPFTWTCRAPASRTSGEVAQVEGATRPGPGLAVSALERAGGRRVGSTGRAARQRSASHDIPNIAQGRPRSRRNDATKVRDVNRIGVVLGA